MPKPTMRDVAKHANVSVATVSHVINSTRFVSAETHDRVMNSIRTLGYIPDAAARSFKTGRRNLIAFVVPDIANTFFPALIEEVENVVNREGYHLLIVNTHETPERELKSLQLLSRGVVDGFIVASTFPSYEYFRQAIPEEEPVIFIDRKPAECLHDTVTVNCYDALYEGVCHLIRNGHKKIGYITGIPHISTSQERLTAYKDAMHAHDLLDDDLIQYGNSMSQCEAFHLDALIAAHCTALVVTNNLMTNEAISLLMHRGIYLGQNIELLGFWENDQLQQELQNVHLLTHLIVQPTVNLGRTAARYLLDRLQNPDCAVRQTVLQAEFLPRVNG